MEGFISTDKVPVGRMEETAQSAKTELLDYHAGLLIQRAEIENILGTMKERKISWSYKIIKRFIDIIVSLSVLLFTWPIIFFISLYIRKASRVPTIFRQIRIKRNRRDNLIPKYFFDPKSRQFLEDRRKYRDPFRTFYKERRKMNPGKLSYLCPKDKVMKPDRRKIDLLGKPFTFYKFRTMYSDAKERFPELYAYKYTKEEIKDMKFKIEKDPRVPEWAKWLRQTSFDELPNFINVLLGDMSLVGPRPDIPEMVKYYTDVQKIKLHVKPGITGLAQIKGRGHLSFQETLKYDIEYVRNRSLMLDLNIIARTILTLFTDNGAF